MNIMLLTAGILILISVLLILAALNLISKKNKSEKTKGYKYFIFGSVLNIIGMIAIAISRNL